MPNEEHFNNQQPLSLHPLPAKPKGGARLLSLLLRLVVMQIFLSFFFLFAGIAVFLLLLLCLAGKFLLHRRRRLRPPPPAERRGLSREEIHLLPCFERFDSAEDDCVVCLEGFREGDLCRLIPGCRHSFHRICVDRWLERSRVCPICRGGVLAV